MVQPYISCKQRRKFDQDDVRILLRDQGTSAQLRSVRGFFEYSPGAVEVHLVKIKRYISTHESQTIWWFAH